MDILIVAPTEANLATASEISRVASGNTATILDGYVSRSKLALTLQTKQFDAIHYAGHGTYDLLTLSDGPLSADELQTMVQGQKHLQLIVLNSCLGAGTAAELHNVVGVPVVMYQGNANDAAAIRYAEVLYTGLAACVPLIEAHTRAKGAIRRTFPDLPDEQLPVIINGAMNEVRDFQAEVTNRLGKLEVRMTGIEVEMRKLNDTPRWTGTFPNLALLTLAVLTVLDMLLRLAHLY